MRVVNNSQFNARETATKDMYKYASMNERYDWRRKTDQTTAQRTLCTVFSNDSNLQEKHY